MKINYHNFNYPQLSDNQLIDLCRQGNHPAYQELVNRHLKGVFNFVLSFNQNKDEAEDVSQEIFLKVWKNLNKFNNNKSFKPWLFAIARNTALDQIKKRKNAAFSEMADDGDVSFEENIEDTAPLISEVIEKEEEIEFLLKNFDLLKRNHQIILRLHYEQEMTFDEISIVTKMPMNTVKSCHFRAINKLRKLLNNAPK